MNKRVRTIHVVTFITSFMFSGWLHAAELLLHPRIQVNTPHVTLSDDVQAWLKDNAQIDVGVWGPSHPPIGDGMNYGLYQGIAADYLAMLENSLQVKFVLHYYQDSNDAMAALGRHDIDMVAMWNPTRWPSSAAKASAPWLLDKSVVITRDNDDATTSSLENLSLGVIPDGMNAVQLRENYPGSLLRYFKDFDQAMNAVSYGQIHSLWLNKNTADYLMRYQHMTGLKTTPSTALPNLNLSFGVDRQLPLLLSAIDSTLQQMPLVSRMRIATGWGLNREAVITRNPLGLTVQEERWLHTDKRIQVIIDSRRPPISFLKNGVPAGLIVDMLDTLTQRYGLNFRLLVADDKNSIMSLQQSYPDALQANNWLLAGLAEPEENAALRSTLMTSPMVVVMQQSNGRPDSFDNLKGERIAINRDNPLVSWLQTWYPSIELSLTDDLYQATELLRSNRVRGFIAPQIVARYLVDSEGDNEWQIAISVPISTAHLVINADHSPSIPLQIINKALADLPPENVIELTTSWHQRNNSLVPGVSDRQLGLTLVSGSVAALTLLISTLWIRRLRAALKRGKQAKEALTDQYNFTRALIDNAPVALYVRDTEGRLMDCNQHWSDTVKLDGQQHKGIRITEISSMDAETAVKLEKQYQQALKKGEPQLWSGPFLFDDEQHYLEGWTVPWRDNRGEIGGLVGGWLDVTEKEALIAGLKQVKEDLEQANRSKAAFMQTMGHEVRTPLNAMIGLLEFEIQNQQQGEPTGENLPLIWESAGNLLSLIGDVFDIFRADNLTLRGMVRSVNLPQLIESTVALYRQQLEEKGLTLEVETALNTPRFEADSLLIIRIFSSLLRNAIKHSQGRIISVAVYQGRQDDDENVPLVIEVSNEGEINADDQRVAEPENVKTGWQETGMNLSACQVMASANGAELSIESDADEGTTISFYFNAKPSLDSRPTTQPQAARVLNILIVDDYPPGRRALQQQLEGWGHHTLQANNGEQALELWQQQGATLDLIITDCTMPVIDGFSLTRLIREEEQRLEMPALPIFGLTAMTGFEITTRCLSAGMNECLIKPLSPAALLTVLQRYFSELNPINVTAQKSITDDPETLREMMQINVEDEAQLRDALAAQDFVHVGRVAHRLKGAATLFHDEQFYSSCEAVEKACGQHLTAEVIESLAETLFKELERTKVILNRKLE
ncbi:histidine kinase [Pantoea endophytica]|uniref:histidine kinase n=1 Tax=Pantoea endophytica TaxID=92488 RepID=A0ABX4STL0_9GAMM|nr:transporter substrate-binding domain-containing protein [Pantoea endophytica]PLR25704.1 histidine kinase [Pantoea endophytica]